MPLHWFNDDNESAAAFLGSYVERAIPFLFSEYPTWNAQSLTSRDDLSTPRERHPLFWGCYDWHSCVHTHWALAAAYPHVGKHHRELIERCFRESLTQEAIEGEVLAWEAMGEWDFFERPYGITWFLELCSQMRRNSRNELLESRAFWNDELNSLTVLEGAISKRAQHWLEHLAFPSRSGMHDQTAWSLYLTLDWAKTARSKEGVALAGQKAIELFGQDVAAPLSYEPSDGTFFSPALNEAMLMGAVLEPLDFAQWLERFMPDLTNPDWKGFPPLPHGAEEDYIKAHFAGLPATRALAWRSISKSHPDPVVSERALEFARSEFSEMRSYLDCEHYSVTHWVGSYVVAWVVGAL